MPMKKVKKAPMESPPSSSYPVGDEARALFKHQSLMQDYEDLLKETEAKRKKMQMAIQKKHKLSAEVKFLRKKYKTLSKNPAQETRCRLKKQPHNKIPQPSLRSARPQNTVNQKDRNHGVKESSISMTTTPEASAPRTTRLLDLNQVSTPSIEEMQELQMDWEPVEVAEKLKVLSVEGEPVSGDLKLSICREVGHNSNTVGKRKISWQDPVALRV